MAEFAPTLYDDTYTGPRWRYALQYRPLASSHVPRGWIVFSDRPHRGYPFGTCDFPRRLTLEEMTSYELVEVPIPDGEIPVP